MGIGKNLCSIESRDYAHCSKDLANKGWQSQLARMLRELPDLSGCGKFTGFWTAQ
jgi:hypothetical protein